TQAVAEAIKGPDVVVLAAEAVGSATIDLLTWLRDQPNGEGVRVLLLENADGQAWRYELFGVRDVLPAASDEAALTRTLRDLGARMGWAR
ncbi:MAG TPA: hypothetical protein VIF09_15555, partial [Polyangiaceae bacterium]